MQERRKRRAYGERGVQRVMPAAGWWFVVGGSWLVRV